jgi:flagellar protein FliS
MMGSAAYLESRIRSADPIELIAILYEYAILSVREARESLAKKDVAERSRMISKTIAIVSELDSSLNHTQGGELSTNLARLYQYMRERLTAANMKKEDAPLAEVESLLSTLAEAWNSVKHAGVAPPVAMIEPDPQPKAHHFSTIFIQETDCSYSSHSWTA